MSPQPIRGSSPHEALEVIVILSSMSWGEYSRLHGLHDDAAVYTQATYRNTQEDYFGYFRRLVESLGRHFRRPFSIWAWIIELDEASRRRTESRLRRIGEASGLPVNVGIIGYPMVGDLLESYLRTRDGEAHSFSEIHDFSLMQVLQNSASGRALYLDCDVYFIAPGFCERCGSLLEAHPDKAMCAYIQDRPVVYGEKLLLPRALTYALYLDLDRFRSKARKDFRDLHALEDVLRDSTHPVLREAELLSRDRRISYDVTSGLTAYLWFESRDCGVIPLDDEMPLESLSDVDKLDVRSRYFVHTRNRDAGGTRGGRTP
jgi:hypothetical protein